MKEEYINYTLVDDYKILKEELKQTKEEEEEEEEQQQQQQQQRA